jgi:RHS repeat-associated protein
MSVTSTTYLAAGAPENGAIADQTIKLLNGNGQVRQEKARGPDSGQNQTWDVVDTIYNNLGQVYQQSRPYRLGAESPVYATATYDALGRTLTATAPDGSVTQTFYNEASRPDVASSAPGETTRVQDAWGRERWGRTDASGRLVEVVEPNPSDNGSVATSGIATTYAYDTLGNLTTVNQGAQTRSFAYDSLGRLTAQKLAETSATLNDAGTYVGSGTWSDVFTYDDRSNLTSRTEARGVKTVYSYNGDPLNRLQSVSWDTSSFGDTGNPIASAAAVSYSYRTKSSSSDLRDVTQLSSVTSSGVSTESYGYATEGRVSSQTMTLSSRSSYPFVTDYIYDSLDRATDVRYPAEYGNGSAPRKVVHHDYDIASRLTGLTYDGQSFASSIMYNAASQATSLNVGSGVNQIAESYSYNAQTGLLENQTVARSTTTLLNLSYDYAGANGKRTGQLTKLLNNLDHNKDRGYSYDALGRLVQATGGLSSSPLSTQTYSYDRYGNRTSVSAAGYSASLRQRGSSPTVREGAVAAAIIKPSDPKVDSPTDLLAKNNSVALPANGGSRTVREGSESVSDSSTSLFKPSTTKTNTTAPTDPPTFTNSPLTAGVEVKAIHITELRDAINALRARLGMSAYSWTESITSGVSIKAAHIIEMRTALDQALGAPSGGYATGLAQGQPILAIHIQELRDRVVAGWTASSQIPRDGHASLSYDTATNRITTSGFAYDAAGNQVRAIGPGGSSSQRFKYDAANRLVQVLADNNTTVLATYTYGDSNERLIAEEGGLRTYYNFEGGLAISEYTESGGSATPSWSKSYVYLGGRLLSTLSPNGSGGEAVQHNHPDRLGTRLVTDPANGTSFEQVTLPFGTALNAESTGATNRRFTTYDRSAATGLDYAYNRHYDAQQGRFTQVDPVGMGNSSSANPQTLNLYSYCVNDPINHSDPSGLGFVSFLKKALGVIARIAKVILVIAAVVVAVVGVLATAGALAPFVGLKFGLLMLGLAGAGFAEAFGPPWLKLAIAVGFAALGIYLQGPQAIWNLMQTGHLGHGSLTGMAASVGAVAGFLQATQHKPKKPKKRPGDFQTLTEAVIAALKGYDVPSISVNAELSDSICEYPDGKLIYTVPSMGGNASSIPSTCPPGTTRVGDYHTHAAYDPHYDNENFSPADRKFANNASVAAGHAVPNFVGTPAGAIKRFDPAVIANSTRGRVTTLRTKINTGPF